MSSTSPFLPGGSYQASSTITSVTLSATCMNLKQQPVQSVLTYTPAQLQGICDIANENGVLTLIQGSSSPVNTGNQFIPAGSYQNSSPNISIQLAANCKTANGSQSLASTVSYTAATAANLTDIENTNGSLELCS